MKAIELFAGVGGFRLGLEQQGIKVVWANEWDKYAADIYDKNFGGSVDRRSIVDVRAEDIPSHDLICGGFPCQAFSVAGKRRGFDETRGTLFFEIMRIAQHHRTPYLFLENVKGLLSHDEGRTFETILRTMDELGYDCQWQVLNSKDFGVPQNRERVFIIGHLRGEPRPQVFPLSEDGGVRDEAREGQAGVHANTLRAGYPGNWNGTYIQKVIEGDYAFTVDTSNTGGVRIKAQGINQPSRGIEVRKDELASTLRAAGGGAQTPKALIEDKIRRLTPLECERLQGFPDGWTEGISDTQRYKTMGNAVTVNVISAIAEKLKAAD